MISTAYPEGACTFSAIQRKGSQGWIEDGAVSLNGQVIGTYIHGLFDDDNFRHAFVNAARAACELSSPGACAHVDRERDEPLNRLAKQVSQSLDLEEIAAWLGLDPKRFYCQGRKSYGYE
jgi:adenosylcobyric acid synthase